MVRTCGTTGEQFRRMLKKAVQQGRAEFRLSTYPQEYVEGLNDARTPVADFFSILLGLDKGDEFLVNQIRSFPLRDVSCFGDSDEL